MKIRAMMVGGPYDGREYTFDYRVRMLNFVTVDPVVMAYEEPSGVPLDTVSTRMVTLQVERWAYLLAEAVYDDNGREVHPANYVGWYQFTWPGEDPKGIGPKTILDHGYWYDDPTPEPQSLCKKCDASRLKMGQKSQIGQPCDICRGTTWDMFGRDCRHCVPSTQVGLASLVTLATNRTL